MDSRDDRVPISKQELLLLQFALTAVPLSRSGAPEGQLRRVQDLLQYLEPFKQAPYAEVALTDAQIADARTALQQLTKSAQDFTWRLARIADGRTSSRHSVLLLTESQRQFLVHCFRLVLGTVRTPRDELFAALVALEQKLAESSEGVQLSNWELVDVLKMLHLVRLWLKRGTEFRVQNPDGTTIVYGESDVVKMSYLLRGEASIRKLKLPPELQSIET